MREFRRAIRHIAEHQHLPEYRLMYREEEDTVTFYSREPHGHTAMLGDILNAHRNRHPVKW